MHVVYVSLRRFLLRRRNAIKRLSVAFVSGFMFLAAGSAAQADDLLFALNNETSVALAEIQLAPSNAQQQKANVLGGQPLLPGEGIDIVIAGGSDKCLYNILGVFADGDTVAGENVDLCELGAFTFLER